MGVHPAYRESGLGTLLLTEALRQAEEYGPEKVELGVFSSNARAISLYRRMGFVREGLLMNYRKLNGEIFNLVLMAKIFSSH